MIKKRGRPLKYDSDEALDSAIHIFWLKGLTATSLDELSVAMKMNRPSIYNAFGNKESVYRKALARFVEKLSDQLETILFSEADLNKAIKLFYSAALDTYFSNSEPLGCFVICTATVEVTRSAEIKSDLNLVINMVDAVLEKRLLQAKKQGNWIKDGKPNNVAKLLHATLQSLAIRARSGESRVSLNEMYSNVVDMLC